LTDALVHYMVTVMKAWMSVSNFSIWNSLRRVLPIVVSVALLYYYFRNVSWPEVIAAARGADAGLLIAGRALPVFVYWWLGAQVTQRLITWFHKPVPLRDIFWARGALSLLLLINMVFSSGGFFIYLIRKTGVSALKLIGMFLFAAGVLIWGYAILLTPAAVYISFHHQGLTRLISPPIVWLILGLCLFWFFHSWTYWRRGWRWGPLSLVLGRDWEMWYPFAHARTIHWFKTGAYVLPPNLLSFVGFYLCAFAFDIHIPAAEFFLLIPLVIIVSALPVAFGGFGTTTAAWLYFFPQYADRETYLALTLVLPVITCLARALTGVISLKPAFKEWGQIGCAT